MTKCRKCKCEAGDLQDSLEVLKDQIKLLTDERDSLWSMLDEIHESDAKNFQESLQAAHEELKLERLLNGPPAGEA